MKLTNKKLEIKEIPEPNLPAMKTYKKAPGDINNAIFAAHHTAKRIKDDVVIIAGNSYGHMVYHLATTKDDLRKYQPGQKKNDVIIVTPKGAVYKALAESERDHIGIERDHIIDKYI